MEEDGIQITCKHLSSAQSCILAVADWLFLCLIFLCTKSLLRQCSNCLPCCHALENTQWGHGQGLLIFWILQKDFSGSVSWLKQLAQVSHLWCGLAPRQLLCPLKGGCSSALCWATVTLCSSAHVSGVLYSSCCQCRRGNQRTSEPAFISKESKITVWYLSLLLLCLFRLFCSGYSTFLNGEPNWCLSSFFSHSSVCPICIHWC